MVTHHSSAPLGRLVVTGGRHYADADHVVATLDRFHAKHTVRELAQGGATGADALAADWAHARGIPVATFRAEWRKHGAAGGPIRNRRMLDEFGPDWVVAFPGDAGTADCVKAARERGIPVWEVKPPRRQP